MNFTIYDVFGRILRTGFCPDGMEHVQAQDGEFMLPVNADLNADYVNEGAVCQRPANPATLEGSKIVGIPKGSTVTISNIDYRVDDGEAELDFTHPGTYSISVRSFPFLTATFTVTK